MRGAVIDIGCPKLANNKNALVCNLYTRILRATKHHYWCLISMMVDWQGISDMEWLRLALISSIEKCTCITDVANSY